MNADEIERRLGELRSILEGAGVEHQILPHETTLHSAEDGVAHGMGSLEEMAPTFLLKTEEGYLAAIISGATRLSYKKIKKRLGLKNVSMASPSEVLQVTGSPVGTVSLIQPDKRTILDERLLALGVGYGGCGVPGHTLRIRIADLVRFAGALVFDFTEPKSGSGLSGVSVEDRWPKP